MIWLWYELGLNIIPKSDFGKSVFPALVLADSEVSALGSNAELFLNERDKDEKDQWNQVERLYSLMVKFDYH